MVKLVFLMKHDKLPGPIMDAFKKWQQRGRKKKHRYNTRNENTPNILPHSNELFNKSFLCRSFTAFQKLPDRTKNAQNLNVFVQY